MRKFPITYQLDSKDCGPSSLKMIANYYGKTMSLEKLRKLTHIVKDGVSLLSLSEAAEEIGFKSVGGKLPFGKLVNDALLPCIIHWEQNHFVVLYKIKTKSIIRKQTKLFIADPAIGKTVYTEQEFKDSWLSTRVNGEDKGVVLLLEPSSIFFTQQESKKKSSGLRFLVKYFLRYKRFFGQLILGLLFGSLIQLIFPFLTQSIVDRGIANKNIGFIYMILLAQMMLILSRASVDFIRRWILLHISTRINISLISDFFIKLMRLPMSYFDTKLTGDILQRIDDHERVERLVTTRSLETIFSIFTLIVFGIVLCIYSLKIFAVFTFGSFLYAIWILLFLKKRRELDYKRFDILGKEQNSIYQLIHGMQEIKLQNYETNKRWEWEDIKADIFKLKNASLRLEQKQEVGNILINESKNILITIIAALAVINNEMTLGMMLATQYIIGQLTTPIEQTIDLIHDLQDTKISLERINEIHQMEDEDVEKKEVLPIKVNKKKIRICNLSFQYEGPHSPKVLNNVSINIPQNKVTAIVGTSGSGKTTLIKLLLQYYNVTNGEINVGNYNLNELNAKWWRKQCGAVMQDSFIFSESISSNIATSDEKIEKDRLIYAAKIANIHDFIMKLPLKYNTVIGNEGQNISQGQRQRILIARAVYKNPPFLFFDEATNALDANNEKAIVENLKNFYTGKTVIVVAHRLSTVKNADQIIVLEKGKILEVGNHEELTVKKGAYYNLVKNQLELGN